MKRSSWFDVLSGAWRARRGGAPARRGSASGSGSGSGSGAVRGAQASQPPSGWHSVPQALSPAEEMRANLARMRPDLDSAPPMVTLLDPSRLWAASPIAALSQAAGAPTERMARRRSNGQRQPGLVERVELPLGGPVPVKVYAVDAELARADANAIGLAMAERSHLTAVAVGAVDAGAMAALLQLLALAMSRSDWDCPQVVFLLQGRGVAHRPAVLQQQWPGHVHVQVLELAAGSQALLRALTQAWAPALTEALPAVPAPSRPAAMPASAATLPRRFADLAAWPQVQGGALVELAQGEVLLPLQPPPGGATLEHTAQVARGLCVALAMQAWNGRINDTGVEELLLLRQDGQHWLRCCRGRPGSGMVLLLRRDTDLARLRPALAALDTPEAWRLSLGEHEADGSADASGWPASAPGDWPA
jgi:hypothetical protein